MLLLAVDTSGKNGGLALARMKAGQPAVEVLEIVPLAGGTFSAQLVSFTGLRVGLAAIKALAEIRHKPIATVSLLEAIVCSSSTRGRVLAALDAGRSEVYVGDYDIGSEPRAYSERLLGRDEFLDAAKCVPVATPDSSIVELALAAGLQVQHISYPRTDVVARVGWAHLERGETVPPDTLDANYIRRSDAEIFSKREP